jgi:hypothetical protein
LKQLGHYPTQDLYGFATTMHLPPPCRPERQVPAMTRIQVLRWAWTMLAGMVETTESASSTTTTSRIRLRQAWSSTDRAVPAAACRAIAAERNTAVRPARRGICPDALDRSQLQTLAQLLYSMGRCRPTLEAQIAPAHSEVSKSARGRCLEHNQPKHEVSVCPVGIPFMNG